MKLGAHPASTFLEDNLGVLQKVEGVSRIHVSVRHLGCLADPSWSRKIFSKRPSVKFYVAPAEVSRARSFVAP